MGIRCQNMPSKATLIATGMEDGESYTDVIISDYVVDKDNYITKITVTYMEKKGTSTYNYTITYDNTEPDENVESEKDKNHGMTENAAIKTLISSVEYDNYSKRNYIYVSGKYPSPPSSSEDYLEVGFCAGTSRYSKVTDISISESVERPSSNSVRTIGINGELKSGTTYYIRPYHLEGTEIICYQADSVQTIGKDIQLSLVLNKTSHNGGTISYDIKQNGTYKLTVSYWSIGELWMKI